MILGIISIVVGVIIFLLFYFALGVDFVTQQTVQHLGYVCSSIFIVGGMIMCLIGHNQKNIRNILEDQKILLQNFNKSDIWNCKKCNKMNLNNAQFCTGCGEKNDL